jgi:DNA polymerase-1
VGINARTEKRHACKPSSTNGTKVAYACAMSADDHFLLVDGHHLFHRTYNALPRSIVGRDGMPFDPPEPPFRRALFAEYRTGRPRGSEEEVANFDAQVSQTLRLLDHLAISHPMVSGYEADDALGTLARLAAEGALRTTIVSGDRDLLQLVGPLVTVFMPKGRTGESFTPALVQERWAVSPEQFTDLKSLVGDPSDRIPGVAGIGPRTAAALLARFSDLDNLYAGLDTLPARQSAVLADHKDRVWLNRRLVTIVTTLDLPTDLAVYRWTCATPWTASALLSAVGLRD